MRVTMAIGPPFPSLASMTPEERGGPWIGRRLFFAWRGGPNVYRSTFSLLFKPLKDRIVDHSVPTVHHPQHQKATESPLTIFISRIENMERANAANHYVFLGKERRGGRRGGERDQEHRVRVRGQAHLRAQGTPRTGTASTARIAAVGRSADCSSHKKGTWQALELP
jgi:hypothetical protein